MRKIPLSLVVLIAVVGISTLIFFNTRATQEEYILIGAILPLSGDVAVYGNNTKRGIDLAVHEINNDGGVKGRKIKIIYEDSKADPRTGVSGMHKLIKNGVQAVIDNSVSSVALAIAPLAEINKIVILSTGSTNSNLSGISPFFFRIWNSDALEGRFSAQFARETLGLSRASIIYVNNDYGNGLYKVFGDEFSSKGGQVVAREAYAQGSHNFRAQLTKIKATGGDLLYIAGYSQENAQIIKQARELGINCQIIGTVTMEDQVIINVAGKFAEGVIYAYPREPDASHSTVATFRKNFKDFYNEDIAITCDVGYDAVYLLAKAIMSEDNTGDGIKIGLTKIKAYEGASGLIEFDANGDVSKPMQFKVIKNGNFQAME